MKIKMLFIVALLSCALVIHAQSYEIRAVKKGEGYVGVQLRITSGTPPSTNNHVTDFVFGLKWFSTYNVDLLTDSLKTTYNVKKSDVRKLKGGYHYQAFYADNTPFTFPSIWTTDTWVEIMNIQNNRRSLMDTGTFAICETGFDLTTDPNIGVNLTDYTPMIDSNAYGVILPVNLLRFEVAPLQNAIRLLWSSSSENNNRGFVIQRPATNSNQFDSIGWVNGKGNSASINNYSFLDKQVQSGVLYYYRLKQINYDGTSKFSAIRSAKISDIDNGAFKISPNPATTVLSVMFLTSPIAGRVHLKVVDANGVVVTKTNTTFILGAKVDINVAHLAVGQYYIVIEQDGNIIFKKPFQRG